MSTMSSKERINGILNRQPVDRIGLMESFWEDTVEKWRQQGHLKDDESPQDSLELDLRVSWAFNLIADLDFGIEVVEEDEDTILERNGNGALLRHMKKVAHVPEHVDFAVKDRSSWEEQIRPQLVDESQYERRIGFDSYRKIKQKCEKEELFFCWAGVNVFESMHPICGHENMLMAMALDPEWIQDMCELYSDMTINLMEILFAKEGKPDGIWFYEDMGFKQKPFMSPQMYKELILPAHKKTFDFAHSLGLKIIVHSCGFVEPLIPGLIEAGMDCLQAMEVKAGMDLMRLKETYGDRIAFCGGMDVRELESNDLSRVQAELEKNLPTAMEGSGYILHSDHSIPATVDYETYRFFRDKGLEMGTY